MESTRGIASLALGILLLATPTPATSDDAQQVAEPSGRSNKLARRLVLIPMDEEQYPYGSGPNFKSVSPSIIKKSPTISDWITTHTGSGTPDKPEVSQAYRGIELPFFSGGKNSLYNNENSEVNPLRQYAPGFPNYPYISNLPSHLLNFPKPPKYSTTPPRYPYHQYDSGFSSSLPPSGSQYSQFSPEYPYYLPKPTSPYPQYGQGYPIFPPPVAQYPQYNRDFPSYPPTPTSNPYNHYPPNYPRYPPPPMYSPYGSDYPYSQGYPYSPPWSPYGSSSWFPPAVPSYRPPYSRPPYSRPSYSRPPYRPYRPNRPPQLPYDDDAGGYQYEMEVGSYGNRPRPQGPSRPPQHHHHHHDNNVEDDKDVVDEEEEDNPVDREQENNDEGFGDENENSPDVKTSTSTPLTENSEKKSQTKQQKTQRVLQ